MSAQHSSVQVRATRFPGKRRDFSAFFRAVHGDFFSQLPPPNSPHGLQLTMEPSEAPSLMLQAEKALPQPVHPRLISYCPTMDLVAVITQEETLDVYRLNGQRAFGLKRKTFESKVDSICWKFNGIGPFLPSWAGYCSARDPLRR